MLFRLTPSAPLTRYQLERIAVHLPDILASAAVSADFDAGYLEVDVSFPTSVPWAKLISGTLSRHHDPPTGTAEATSAAFASTPEVGSRFAGPNHALLAGEVWGSLCLSGLDAEVEADDDGNYTGRIIVRRESGTWIVRVEPLEVTEP